MPSLRIKWTDKLFIGIAACLLMASCAKDKSCEGCVNGNHPPVANAGKDTSITRPANTAQLNGSQSKDPDNNITTFKWTKISGPSANIEHDNAETTRVNNLIEGIYLFELKVTDAGGLFAKDTVIITVNSAINHAPVANAGNDTTIILPANAANLDGRKSTDPDNNITSYQWTKIAGPSSYSITNAYVVQTQANNLVEGIYQFELKATDAGGLFAKDTLQITVLSNATSEGSICISGRPEINAQLIPFGTLSSPKSNSSVAAAGNKIVFASGWANGTGGATSLADIYDLTTQTWSTYALQNSRYRSAVAVNGDKIFFAGGGYFYDDNYDSTVEIYNATNNSWNLTSLLSERTEGAGVSIGDKVIFAGGYDTKSATLSTDLVEIYETGTNTWQTAKLSQSRGDIAAVAINGKAYFAGGSENLIYPYGTESSVIDIYDYATNSWSVSKLSFLSTAGTAIAKNEEIFWTKEFGSCDVEIRNVNTGISRLEHLSRSGLGLIHSVIKDDKVVFIQELSKYFDIYNTTTKEWSVGVLPQTIFTGAAVIAVNNVIYIAGGATNCIANPTGCTPVYTNQIWKLEF